MNRISRAMLLAAICCASPSTVHAQQYSVHGMVLEVDPARRTFSASIQSIPNFMPAMVMPFDVLQARELDGLSRGSMIEFTLVVKGKAAHAEGIRLLHYESTEQDPLTANRLKLLNQLTSGSAASKAISVGQTVPDFTLIDQSRHRVSLSQLRGRVVALTFIYTSCVLPNLCLRTANNLAVLQKRFAAKLGSDLVLLAVTFDPSHDTPEVLAQYAEQWKAHSATWHFLTGPAADVKPVCAAFGVDAFPEEGLMNHSLHTALIDREGRLITNIEGNQFTATQLGDLTEKALKQ